MKRLFFILSILIGFLNKMTVQYDPVNDSLALEALYNSTNESGWTNNTNWLVPDQAIGTLFGATVNTGRLFNLFGF